MRFRFRKYSFSVIYMRCPVRFYTIIALSKREYSAKKPSKNCTIYYYLLMKTLFGGFCRQIAVPFLHKKTPPKIGGVKAGQRKLFLDHNGLERRGLVLIILLHGGRDIVKLEGEGHKAYYIHYSRLYKVDTQGEVKRRTGVGASDLELVKVNDV